MRSSSYYPIYHPRSIDEQDYGESYDPMELYGVTWDRDEQDKWLIQQVLMRPSGTSTDTEKSNGEEK